MSLKDIFDDMTKRLDAKPEVAEKINASYLFDFGDEKWSVDLTKKSDFVTEGAIENPGVTVTMKPDNFRDLVGGKLNPQMAFMSGKLKIKGDMSLALKLQQILG